jgi:hypothetical protein
MYLLAAKEMEIRLKCPGQKNLQERALRRKDFLKTLVCRRQVSLAYHLLSLKRE